MAARGFRGFAAESFGRRSDKTPASDAGDENELRSIHDVMKSFPFVKNRALATRQAQASVADQWVWSEKTVAQWDSALTDLENLSAAERTANVNLQSQIANWDVTLKSIERTARDVVRLGRTRFRRDPARLALFKAIRVQSGGRESVQQSGLAVLELWNQADAAWEPLPGITSASFGALLATSTTQKISYTEKFTAWREASAALMARAETLDDDCVAWYSDATTRFRQGTPEGDLIRSTVPTTTSPTEGVGQAVISHLLVTGAGTIHFDCVAPHATRFTYLHKPPGSPQFVVLLAETTETSVTLEGQPAGEHRFKAFGSNSQGVGEESEEAVLTLAASQAA
jgi:hypothetical protein